MTPTVVLLHGLARRRGSMAAMERALIDAGFPTWSIDYPSRHDTIAGAASDLIERIATELPDRPLAAVTHSLGGILFRHLRDRRLAWHRAVMLAPPNHGSQTAAAFAHHPLFRWFYGPAGQELAGASQSIAWPPPPASFAVIAGTKRRAVVNPTSWVSGRVFASDRDHDGTVAVDETRLDTMAGFATVEVSHTTIMDDPRTQSLAIEFLRHGRLGE
jgi:triacylglycerol esterase/lipase EstA (alpha/beta hydrolase family)